MFSKQLPIRPGAPARRGLLSVSTALANYAYWKGLDEENYRREKEVWVCAHGNPPPPPLFRALTGGRGGKCAAALWICSRRAPWKKKFTPPPRRSCLRIACLRPVMARRLSTIFFSPGTDQGFLGITGAMLSGISMANRHILAEGRGGASGTLPLSGALESESGGFPRIGGCFRKLLVYRCWLVFD